MKDDMNMRSVGFAWIGTGSTWVLIEQAQTWAAFLAGVLTAIYTAMKIYDWVREKLKARGKFPGPHD